MICWLQRRDARDDADEFGEVIGAKEFVLDTQDASRYFSATRKQARTAPRQKTKSRFVMNRSLTLLSSSLLCFQLLLGCTSSSSTAPYTATIAEGRAAV